MTTALYIALGILVTVLVAVQVWIARASAKMAGDRSRLVLAIRVLNTLLLVAAIVLVAYSLTGR